MCSWTSPPADPFRSSALSASTESSQRRPREIGPPGVARRSGHNSLDRVRWVGQAGDVRPRPAWSNRRSRRDAARHAAVQPLGRREGGHGLGGASENRTRASLARPWSCARNRRGARSLDPAGLILQTSDAEDESGHLQARAMPPSMTSLRRSANARAVNPARGENQTCAELYIPKIA